MSPLKKVDFKYRGIQATQEHIDSINKIIKNNTGISRWALSVNISERGIRPAVQWRKVCFGNRSDNGAILTSRLLTVVRTCWLQERNALDFLVNAISSYRKKLPVPSLLD